VRTWNRGIPTWKSRSPAWVRCSIERNPVGSRHAEQYLRGLLAPIQRKNGWTIAEYVGESEPKALQRFLNLSPWNVDRLLELNRDYMLEHFASPSAILVADPIGNALVAKAGGAGFCSIAARFGRPESTVRRWLRAVREPHAQWLYQRGVDSAVLVDLELLDRPAPQRTTLGHGLNLLAGAAVRLRDSFDISDPVWSLIGFFAQGRLLAPPRPLRS
jgi:transposase-like protein